LFAADAGILHIGSGGASGSLTGAGLLTAGAVITDCGSRSRLVPVALECLGVEATRSRAASCLGFCLTKSKWEAP